MIFFEIIKNKQSNILYYLTSETSNTGICVKALKLGSVFI